MIDACIFDLDGVIVDTAKYHYLAWKRMASMLGIDFTEKENENLKGVSRKESLEYILKHGKALISESEKIKYAIAKNEWYVEYINNLSTDEILPGVIDLLEDLKKNNIKIALGSASKNAMPILKSTNILSYFDFIADGNSTDKSKPDPEVFLIAAKGVNKAPNNCIVFEDSISGIEAAILGNFRTFGVGEVEHLNRAEHVFPNLDGINWNKIQQLYK